MSARQVSEMRCLSMSSLLDKPVQTLVHTDPPVQCKLWLQRYLDFTDSPI